MIKYNMFKFIEKTFFLGLTILSDFTNSNSLLNWISMKNQACKVSPKIINFNSNEPVFHPFSIKTSKCSGSCNNINETRHIKWHETCKCKCSLDASVCNKKQRWNNDKCQCECK